MTQVLEGTFAFDASTPIDQTPEKAKVESELAPKKPKKETDRKVVSATLREQGKRSYLKFFPAQHRSRAALCWDSCIVNGKPWDVLTSLMGSSTEVQPCIGDGCQKQPSDSADSRTEMVAVADVLLTACTNHVVTLFGATLSRWAHDDSVNARFLACAMVKHPLVNVNQKCSELHYPIDYALDQLATGVVHVHDGIFAMDCELCLCILSQSDSHTLIHGGTRLLEILCRTGFWVFGGNNEAVASLLRVVDALLSFATLDCTGLDLRQSFPEPGVTFGDVLNKEIGLGCLLTANKRNALAMRLDTLKADIMYYHANLNRVLVDTAIVECVELYGLICKYVLAYVLERVFCTRVCRMSVEPPAKRLRRSRKERDELCICRRRAPHEMEMKCIARMSSTCDWVTTASTLIEKATPEQLNEPENRLIEVLHYHYPTPVADAIWKRSGLDGSGYDVVLHVSRASGLSDYADEVLARVMPYCVYQARFPGEAFRALLRHFHGIYQLCDAVIEFCLPRLVPPDFVTRIQEEE